MKHRVGFNKLGLKESHRKALHRNMATSLFRYERITTTNSKALAVKRTVEKMITRAKIDSVHNRRLVARDIGDKEILAKLFTDIAPRNEKRPGGYTRILKLGARQGDAADMVILELVDREGTSSSDNDKASKKAKKDKKKDTLAKKAEVKEDIIDQNNSDTVLESEKQDIDQGSVETKIEETSEEK